MVLKLRVSAPENWAQAKCLGVLATGDYDPFFDDQPEAVSFCNGEFDGNICPVRHECLIFALGNNQREGVWGGCTEITRRAMRRRWPMINRQPRSEWRWMTEEQALAGVPLLELFADDDEEEEEDDEA